MKKNNNIVIGNWKMKLSVRVSQKLASNLLVKLKKNFGTVVVCPDFSSLESVSQVLKGSHIKLGAQDAAWANQAALTGAVSPANLKELGVKYVILGHSERRQYFAETDEIVNQKVLNVLNNKLTPIICIGEARRGANLRTIFSKQLQTAFKGVKIKISDQIIVAYEPVWAIGTGQVITVAEVLEAHQLIREILEKIYSPVIFARHFRLVYGGSVAKDNVAQFNNLANINGLLVGGASLKPVDFWTICQTMLQ